MDFIKEYQAFLSPLAIMVSACIALISVRVTINNQRTISRTRATSDLITTIETDKDIIESENTFSSLKKTNFKTIIDNTCTTQERLQIITFLNMYENIFLGITMDALDELHLFRYKRGVILSHWDSVQDLVFHWREQEGNGRIYEIFELFVVSWQQNSFVCRDGKYPHYYLHNKKVITRYQDGWL